jgi:acetyltransferase-like isoleucine patch superfamily enzyme
MPPLRLDAQPHRYKICFEFNQTPLDDFQKKNELIRKLFGKTGSKFYIEPYLWCDFGYNIEIGENFYSNHNLVILDHEKIVFGNNVLIGPNCGFYAADHSINTNRDGLRWICSKSIAIGNSVWICGNVVVLPGVRIGDNSVIGAGSVVARDIPANAVAAGNPCKVLREIENH